MNYLTVDSGTTPTSPDKSKDEATNNEELEVIVYTYIMNPHKLFVL